ncbi:MAG: formylmethanofuran dehydrogenase subunit A [Planctomycetota bacterium]
MSYLKLSGGTIVDPANGIDLQRDDIWIRDGKVVAPPDSTGNAQVTTVDVEGMVVMPGAIDMHCHIAGPKVNIARQMQPEMTRLALENGVMANVPDLFTAGFRYTGLGYTTCFDAAVSPLSARQVHSEFCRIPNLDTGFFALMGNNHRVLDCVARQDAEGLDAFLGWLINRCGAFAPKLVNPGGVELWKRSAGGNADDLDTPLDNGVLTPRRIIRELAMSANRLGLPHPVHIHTNNLGMPGNWRTTLETMKSLAGIKSHLTHIQFHSYGGGDADGGDNAAEAALCSRVPELSAYINEQDEITVDVGQVMFGRTTSMTGDGPLGNYLHRIHGDKWYSADTELESGCGVSPVEYKNRNLVNALQWVIGLEWYLLVKDPWKVVMSTDHPNGGSFVAYPQIVRLLMDRAYRTEKLSEVNERVLKYSTLESLDREYSLFEIAIITRAGPARILGLKSKGHIGAGADADITVYAPDANYEKMFSLPRYVLKGGEFVVQDYEIVRSAGGSTISADVSYDRDQDGQIDSWFDDHYSISSSHFRVSSSDYGRNSVRIN